MLLAFVTLVTAALLMLAWSLIRTIRSNTYHRWPRYQRWPFFVLVGLLIIIGASLIIGLAIAELGDARVGLGTGVLGGLIAGLVRQAVPSSRPLTGREWH